MESEELSPGADNKITPKISGKRKLFPRQIDNLTPSGRKNEDSFLTQDQQMDYGSISHAKNSDTEDITKNSDTPDDYEPKGFHAADETDFVYASESPAKKFPLGKGSTNFHETNVQKKSVCCIEDIIFGDQVPVEASPDISVIKTSVSEIPLKSKSNLIMNHMDTIPESSSKDDTVQQPSDIVSPEISSNKKSKLTKSDVKSSETQSSKKLPTLQGNNISSISQPDKSLGEPNKSLDGPNKSLGEQNDRIMSEEKSPSSLLKKCALNDVPLKKKMKRNVNEMKENSMIVDQIDSSNVINDSNTILSKSASKNDNDMGPPKNVPRQLNKKKRNARISGSDDEIIEGSSEQNMKKDEKFEEKKIRTPQSKKRVKIQEPVEQNNYEMRSPVTAQILPRSMTKRRSLFCETLLDNDKVKKSHTSVSNDQSHIEFELPSGADNKITPKISGKRKLFSRQIDNLTHSERKNEDSFLTQEQQMGNSGSISHPKNSDTEDITEYSGGAITYPEENVRFLYVNTGSRIFKIVSVGGGGDCLFRTLCVFLHGNEESHEQIRNNVTNHIVEHFEDIYRDLLVAFDVYSPQEYRQQYGKLGDYGGEIEITAAGRLYQRKIELLRDDRRFESYNSNERNTWHIRFSGPDNKGHFEPMFEVFLPRESKLKQNNSLIKYIRNEIKENGIQSLDSLVRNVSKFNWKDTRLIRSKIYKLLSTKEEVTNVAETQKTKKKKGDTKHESKKRCKKWKST